MLIVVTLYGAIFLWRNDSLSTGFIDYLEESVGIVASIRNHAIEQIGLDQCFGLSGIMPLATGQYEAQWVTQRINKDVNLGAESATAPT